MNRMYKLLSAAMAGMMGTQLSHLNQRVPTIRRDRQRPRQ